MAHVQTPEIDINKFAKAMEDMWNEKEALFAVAESLSPMQKTCPDHKCGTRDFERLAYICPVCKKILQNQ